MHALDLELKVNKLEILEHSERFGDEVYLHVLESHDEKLYEHHLPKYPFYYREGHLKDFKPTILWKKSLNDSEKVTLFISLIEKDAAPWNIDDLIGQLTLTLKIVDEKLQATWDMVDKENLDKVISKDQKNISLELFNDIGRYQLDLALEIV